MSKLQDDAAWLANQIADIKADTKALGKPQLATSSIEAGSIPEYDADGTLVSVTGAQFDGTHGSVTVAGPVPPEPVAPSVTVGAGQVEVRWSGKFLDDAVSPMDFSHVSVHVSDVEAFTPDNDTQRATITGESGDVATVLTESGQWFFLLVAVSKAGKWSDPSVTVVAEVTDILGSDQILDEFISLDEKLATVDTSLAQIQIGVDGKTAIHNDIVDAPAGEFAEGDRWQKWTTLEEGGDLLMSWRYTAGAWVKESMSPNYLPKVDIGQGTFGELDGGRLKARSASIKTLLVGSFDNVIPDPEFTNIRGEWGTPDATYSFPSTEGYGGLSAFKIAPSTAQAGRYSSAVPVEGGSSYWVTVWVKSNVAIPASSIGVYMRSIRADGTLTTTNIAKRANGVAGHDAIAANTWARISGYGTHAADIVQASFGFYTQATFTAGTAWFSLASATRRGDGNLLVDGAVTATKLEAELVLATDIVAGNPAGTHARLNKFGFRALASTDGNAPTEVIRMGTDTDDYFGVVNAAGELVASITSGGDMTGRSGDFAEDVSIGGTSLLETINNMPRGQVAWAARGTDGKYWAAGTPHPYLHLVFPVEAGRAYMISSSAINVVRDTSSSIPILNLHYTGTAGSTGASTSSPLIQQLNVVESNATLNRLITPDTTGLAAALISYKGTNGRARIISSSNNAVILSVEDIGASSAQTGELRDGPGDGPTGGGTDPRPDPTPPPVVRNYDKTWNATGLRSFIGSGASYDYNTGYMYSGLSPSGYGDLSSMAVFPNLTGELSGATITAMWVYVYYDFWYQGSGGNAYIGFHGQTGLTGTRPAKTYQHAISNGWPRAAGRWVALSSSTFAGWKAGTHRGITLGGSGGGYERYGYAHDIRIRAKYTK